MKPVSSSTLLLISSLSYFFAVGFDARRNIIGSAFAILGLIMLLIGIVNFIKEKRQQNKNKS